MKIIKLLLVNPYFFLAILFCNNCYANNGNILLNIDNLSPTIADRYDTSSYFTSHKNYDKRKSTFSELLAMQESGAASSSGEGEVFHQNPSPPNPTTTTTTTSPASPSEHHKISLLNLLINLWADILPHGMMPLAFGLSRGKSGPTGIIPAIGMLVIFGWASSYNMVTYAKLAASTKSKSAGEVWGKIMGRKTEWVVDLSLFALCFGCCIFYSAFIGDIFGSLASIFRIGGVTVDRTSVLLGISTFILLPLCLLEDLSALQFSSLMGFVGIMYTASFTAYRWAVGTYKNESPMLQFVEEKMRPKWPQPKYTLWRVNSGTLVLANMLCLGFLVHYNAIPYYRELADPSQYQKGINIGFAVVMTIFGSIMFLGYDLFGISAQPLMLNNFAKSKDFGANLARLGTGLAIVSAYPLMFGALKSSLFGLINHFSSGPDAHLKKRKRPSDVNKRTQNIAIFTTIAIITSIAVQCGEEDVSLILGIVGSVLGCFTAYIMPSSLRLVQRSRRKNLGLNISLGETLINWSLIATGTIFGGLGVWITIKEELEKVHDHA